MERRKFLQDGGMAAAAGMFTFSADNNTEKSAKNMFIHHVYFWLKNPGSKEDLKALIKGLQDLSKIDYIQMFHIGVPADTHRDVVERSYAVSWLNVFKNKADEERYQNDPVHLKFIDTCKHLWEKVVVYDSVDA